jgi:tetratricopeptide (TPR) repeat protein
MLLKSILPAAFLVVCTSAFGQTLIEKADKQYELHAYRMAAQSYETILAQNASQTAVSLRLADCYLHLNNLPKAANQYIQTIRTGRARAEDYLAYGRVLMMLGQYETAEQQFNVYRNTNPTVATQFIKACQYARSNSEAASDYAVEPLSKISTTAANFGVAMWKDQLIWSSTRIDFKRAQNNAQQNDLINGEANQLFIAPIEGVSRKPFSIRFLKSDLKNTYNESNPSFTADGKMVAFMRNNIADDERITSNGGLEMSVFLADVDADGNWLNARPFPYNNGSTGFPALSPDGNTIYFTSNRSGGYGGFDIYQSDKRGNFWGEPKNLGPTVNSQGDEITPFFDGTSLFFSSDWHFGFGGYDIFKVQGNNIVNLGTGVNSSGDDFNFIFDPSVSTGFFVSNRKGIKGKTDIFKVTLSGETANIVILDGNIPLKEAKVRVIQGNSTNITQMKGGNYLANLSDRKSLTLEISKSGFKTQAVKIDPSYSNTSRIVEVALQRDVPTQMSNVPEYSAMITNDATGEPLEGVVVRLTNQTNNTQSETTTDVKGKFRFPMSLNASLLLTFSKEGFVIAQKFIKANELKTKYLGEFALRPSAVSDYIASSTTISQANPQKMAEKPQDVPKDYSVNVLPSSARGEQENVSQNVEKPNIPVVYSVQIAVVSLNSVVSLSKYDDLRNVGHIYSVPENNLKKIRLGIYKTRDEAVAASKRASTLGYKGVFIVTEKNEQAIAENIYTPIPKPIQTIASVDNIKTKGGEPSKSVFVPVPPKPKEEIPTPYSAVAPVKKAAIVEDKTFKVRIAAMKKPEWFDDSKVSQLWKIDKFKDGDLTIFIMDGFKTLKEAKVMKQKVKDTGYNDAKVIQKNGTGYKVVD